MRKFMLFVAALVATLGLAQLQIGAAGASPVPGLSASKSNSATQVNTSTQSAQNWSKTVQVAPVTNIAPELALFGSNGGSSVVSAPSSTTDQSVNQKTIQANGASQSGTAKVWAPTDKGSGKSDPAASQTNTATQSNSASQSASNSSETVQVAPVTNIAPELALFGSNGGSSVVSAPSSTTDQSVNQTALQANGASQSGEATASSPKAGDDSGNCGCTSGEPPKANGDDHSHGCGCTPQPSTPPKADHDHSGNCGCTSGEPPKANGDDHSHGCGCTPEPSTPPKAGDDSGNCSCTSGEPPKANGDDDHSHDCGRNSGGPTAAWEGNTESQSNSLSQSNSSSQEASNSSTTEQIAPVTNVAPELAVLGSTGGSTVISSPSSSTTQGVSQGVAQLNGAQQSGQASNVGP